MRKVLVFTFIVVLFSISVSAFEFNGTVYDPSGNTLANVSVNLTNYTIGLMGPQKDTSINVTTNESGWFNISMDNNANAQFKPVLLWTNTTSNHIQYVGQSLPTLPYQEIQSLSPINFYLKEAATMNLTVINASGNNISFGYIIKDTKLGYRVASNTGVAATGDIIYLPRDRNYSVMIWSSSLMSNPFVPVSFEWNNFTQTEDESFGVSSYNATKRTLHKQFNISQSFARITGFINGSDNGVELWDNFTIVPIILEPSGMVFINQGTLPYNVSAWNALGSDFYNKTSGFYNITLPYASQETVKYLLYASGYNGSTYLGSYRNITVAGDLDDFNFSMFGLLGDVANITMTDPLGGASRVVWTKKLQFNLHNSSNITIDSITAHTETKVDYSNYNSRAIAFMEDVQADVGNYFLPLLNVTGINEINVYTSNYAPKRVGAKTITQLNNGGNNITLKSFQPGGEGIPGQDAISQSDITMALFSSNATCDVPNANSKCDFTSSSTLDNFNPFKFVVGGGKISFRMGKGGVIVHYVNADLLASGPPDALFEDNSGVTGSGDSFESALRFGSNGPTIYDYILISMPYSEVAGSGLNDGEQVNISIKNFYDDDWNVVWNTSTNGTNGSALGGNLSHYNTKQDDWEVLMGNNVCSTGDVILSSQINVSNPCYLDTTNNQIWIRLPHFSGTGPSVSGSTTAAASSTSSSTSSSSSSSGSGGSSSTQAIGKYAKEVWSSVNKGQRTSLKLSDDALAISDVSFDVNKKMYGLWMKVTKKDVFPSSVNSFVRKSYQKFKILKSPNLKESILENSEISFRVEKIWVEKEKLNSGSVALFRYVDDAWNELETTKVSQDDTYFSYVAKTPGFSYFLVGEREVKVIPRVEEKVSEKVVEESVVIQDPSKEVVSGPQKTWPWVILVLVLVLGITWWLMRNKD